MLTRHAFNPVAQPCRCVCLRLACTTCRFYHQHEEFKREMALYQDPLLKALLPELLEVIDNADGAVRSRSGLAFPPFAALERGARSACVLNVSA